jgi:hypothetical protein
MVPSPEQPGAERLGTEQAGGELPPLPVSLARAAAPGKRAATATTQLPESRAVVTGWVPDRARLAEYRTLVGSSAELPIAFPQVPVMAMHMDLISRWSFPIRAMGLVHAGSVVEVLDTVPTDEAWDLRVWGSPGRNVRSGLEFDLWGEVSSAGRVLWRSRAVYLSHSRAASGAEESTVPQASAEGPWESEVVLPVPESAGRDFARVTGDINPIHMHAAPARLFGFRRAIAHGWWTTARVAALLGRDRCEPGRVLEIVFRRPVDLPSAPVVSSRARPDGSVEFVVEAERASGDPGPMRRPLVMGRFSG